MVTLVGPLRRSPRVLACIAGTARPSAPRWFGRESKARSAIAIGPQGRFRIIPVPTLDTTLLWVDLLVPLIPRHDSERLQCVLYRSRPRNTLVRPHRFTDIQASSIGVHFSSSIV